MNNFQPRRLQRQLEWVLITLFVLVAFNFVVVYAADPAIYAQVLSLQPSAAPSHPLPMTLVLVAALAFIAVLIVGVRCHWRWVFWIILVAFSAAVLHVLVALLQLVGVLPNVYPVWFSLYRIGIACVQVVIAVWIWGIYVQHGTWALWKKSKRAKYKQANLTNHESSSTVRSKKNKRRQSVWQRVLAAYASLGAHAAPRQTRRFCGPRLKNWRKWALRQ